MSRPASTAGARSLGSGIAARGPRRTSRQRKRPMLGPVMASDLTGNAHASPTLAGAYAQCGHASFSAHARDRSTEPPLVGSYTVADGDSGSNPRWYGTGRADGAPLSSLQSPRSFRGPAAATHSTASPSAYSNDAMRIGMNPSRRSSAPTRSPRDARIPEPRRVRQ